jgi:hypothetical protein
MHKEEADQIASICTRACGATCERKGVETGSHRRSTALRQEWLRLELCIRSPASGGRDHAKEVKGLVKMVPIRALALSLAAAAALVPMTALAVDQSEEHLRAEYANAIAQQQISVEQAADLRELGQQNMDNERMIALLDSEAARQRQLGLVSNGNAIEQISKALANSFRLEGDLNARNELIIAQGKAAVLIAKADADMANALAQGRQTEIDNAKAQGMLFRETASFISGALAETNMNSSKIRGETQADLVHTPGLAEAANGQAMGAAELLVADLELQAGELAAFSSDVRFDDLAAGELEHAGNSVENAIAQLKEAGFDAATE